MDKRTTLLGTPNSNKENPSPDPQRHKSPQVTSSSSKDVPPITLVRGLRALILANNIELDSDAIERLWKDCKNRVPDCNVTEILHFSRAKAALFSSGKITNPVGFLLFSVPKCFEGPSFHQYRQEQEQVRRAEEENAKRAEQEMEEVQRQLKEMLNNPMSSEEDRRFAKRLLNEGR